MTNAAERDPSWLVDKLRTALPKADITVYKPSPTQTRGGGWVIDAVHRNHFVVVMWTKATGFGISTPADDDGYDSKSDETIKPGEQALERILHLLKTGAKAGDRKVTLDELRALVGTSQERLADEMKVTQSMVSQTENRDDILLSTLQSYIHGLGGELELVAKFKKDNYRLDVGALKKTRSTR